MEFKVSSLLKESTGAHRDYDIDDDMRVDGELRHLTGHVRFDRTTDGILVRARLHGAMDADCSRCLRPVTAPVDIEFDEQYLPTIDVDSGAHIEPPEGQEDAYRIDERHDLSLREPIEQYWAMTVPMAPVCDEACAGLCPICGEDMRGGHACTPEQVDARWAKLQDLRLR